MLNKAVMGEFQDVMKKLNDDSRVRAAVLASAKDDIFIAGADVS